MVVSENAHNLCDAHEKAFDADKLRADLKRVLLEVHAMLCAMPPEEWSLQRQLFVDVWKRNFITTDNIGKVCHE